MTGHIINFFIFFSLQIWIESNEICFMVKIFHQWSGDVLINTQCARHYDNCFMNGPWMLYKFYCRFRFDQWLYGISFYNLEYEVFSKNVYGCIAMFYIMYSRILYKEIYLAFFFSILAGYRTERETYRQRIKLLCNGSKIAEVHIIDQCWAQL